MFLDFSNSDEYIMDKVKAVIEKEATVQYNISIQSLRGFCHFQI